MKLNNETINHVLKLLQHGMPVQNIGRYLGVPDSVVGQVIMEHQKKQ